MASRAHKFVQVTECKQIFKLNKYAGRGIYKIHWCYKDFVEHVAIKLWIPQFLIKIKYFVDLQIRYLS